MTCIFSARPFPYGVGSLRKKDKGLGNIFFVALRGHRPRSYTHEPTSKVQSQNADYTPIYSPLFIKTVTLIIHHPTLRIQASLSECWIMYEINKFIFFMNNCSLNLRICKFYSTFARFLEISIAFTRGSYSTNITCGISSICAFMGNIPRDISLCTS